MEKMQKKIKEMKAEIASEMTRLPNFITSTSILHHALWNNMTICNNLIFSLISDRVLSDSTILKIAEKFDAYALKMVEAITPAEQLHLAAYYSNLFSFIMEKCLEIEAYEACSNIYRFDDIYNERREDE